MSAVESTGDGPRHRLLDAMATVLRAGSYDDATVAEVVRVARVSRRTFYEHFADRHACLEALLEQTNTQIMAAVAAAVDPGEEWRVQVGQAVDAWVACIRRDPAVTLSWIRIVPALGERGRRFDRRTRGRYAEMIQSLVDRPEVRARGVEPLPDPVATLLIGGLRELVATTVEDGGDLDVVAQVASATFVRVLSPSRDAS
ncbi:MAG: TetR/AcrR family transcriptional regulator [Nocardioidaceae bacterium]|nr:TetR/AcrR family transcriptional regulator [Nocardioidaceae bacterium]